MKFFFPFKKEYIKFPGDPSDAHRRREIPTKFDSLHRPTDQELAGQNPTGFIRIVQRRRTETTCEKDEGSQIRKQKFAKRN